MLFKFDHAFRRCFMASAFLSCVGLLASVSPCSRVLANEEGVKPSSSSPDQPESAAPGEKEPAAKAPAKKKVKTLSPEMAERRDRVRQLLTALRTQPFNTQQNTCTNVLDFCRAFG